MTYIFVIFLVLLNDEPKTLDKATMLSIDKGRQIHESILHFHGGKEELKKIDNILIRAIFAREYRSNLNTPTLTIVNCKRPAFVENTGDRITGGFDGTNHWLSYNSPSQMLQYQQLSQYTAEDAITKWSEFLVAELCSDFSFVWLETVADSPEEVSRLRVFDSTSKQAICDLWVLPSGQITRQDIPTDKELITYYFRDYKEFGAIKFPTVRQYKGDRPFTETISSLELNPPIDDEVFKKWPDGNWTHKAKQ